MELTAFQLTRPNFGQESLFILQVVKPSIYKGNYLTNKFVTDIYEGSLVYISCWYLCFLNKLFEAHKPFEEKRKHIWVLPEVYEYLRKLPSYLITQIKCY
uniref:Uncharacterized protein n=1 Tax=Schistocephalus solidus TaxID=70667 RepID=A0A0X3QAS0_SCHSO